MTVVSKSRATATALKSVGADEVDASVLKLRGDEINRGVGISAQQSLEYAAVLGVVFGDLLRCQDQFFHSIPLGVKTNHIDLLIHADDERVAGTAREFEVKFAIKLREQILIVIASFELLHRTFNAFKIAAAGMNSREPRHVRFNGEARLDQL